MPGSPRIVPGFRWPLLVHSRVRTAGRFPLDDRDFGFHYRTATHALHLHEYEGAVRIGKREFALQPGDLTVTPAGTESRYHLPVPGHHLCIHFDPVDDASKGQAAWIPLHVSLGPWREFVAGRMRSVGSVLASAREDALGRAAASAALQELLLLLALRFRDVHLPVHRRRVEAAVDQTAEWLLRHLDEPLDVPELSRRMGISQNYLARWFRARFGTTIPRFLLMHRIERARHLLATTNLPVKTVGERVGIPDPQHFNKQFRLLVGESPSATRAASRRDDEWQQVPTDRRTRG